MEYNDPNLDLMVQQLTDLRAVSVTARCCSTVIFWDPPLEMDITPHPDDPDELIWEVALRHHPQVSMQGETLRDACHNLTSQICSLVTEDPSDPCYGVYFDGVIPYLRQHCNHMVLTVPDTCVITEVKGREVTMWLEPL